jgi:hypothetical protein
MDSDIVLGNISEILTSAYTDRHDVMSSDLYRLVGPMSLFRNTAGVNHLFKLANQYTGARSDSDHDHDPRTLRFVVSRAASIHHQNQHQLRYACTLQNRIPLG